MKTKELRFVGSAKNDLSKMPQKIKDHFGHAFFIAQQGGRHPETKALHGFGSAGVLEVIETTKGGTYRGVYTVKFAEIVYVLHCFQKKSHSGNATPKPDMDLINARLKIAELNYFEEGTKK